MMAPFYWITSVLLTGLHQLTGEIFGVRSGWSWALAIVGLTLTIRAALIPLFVRQIRSSRNMQLVQPQVKELQKKYGHDRERLAKETMALYKETGTNPYSSCLPLLLQMPIFISLFRLLSNAAHGIGKGVLTSDQARQFGSAKLLGVHLANTFATANGNTHVRFLAGTLVVAMTATTFITQRQLMTKNMPPGARKGPYAQQQKMLLYVLPVMFAFGGLAFPIGVLIYWTTSNMWTMGQQLYVIRRNPAPGTPAAEAKAHRDSMAGKGRLLAPPLPQVEDDEPLGRRARPRPQPKKAPRSKRRNSSGTPRPRKSGPIQGGPSDRTDDSVG